MQRAHLRSLAPVLNNEHNNDNDTLDTDHHHGHF